MVTAGAALLVLLAAACGSEPELQQPVPLYGENPIEYPVELWDQDLEGTTVLRLRVSDTGQVDSVEVEETSGHDALDRAAVDGASSLRFEPGRKDGKRVRMWASLPVEFSRRPRSSNDP
ncbi:MAG: energy transducer TonB [Gemmatimonadales bacterium]|nr:MAG: energy transducer TonB [Gemmatimonadales bacterium]